VAQRIFKPTQLFVDSLEDQVVKDQLSSIFTDLEAKRTVEVEKNREANKIQLQAQIRVMKAVSEAVEAKAEADILQFSLLQVAAKHFSMVSQEAQWVAYRDKNGKIVLESIFTRRDQRNALRVEKANLEAAAGAGDFTSLFESNDEKEEKHIGFSGNKTDAQSEQIVEVEQEA